MPELDGIEADFRRLADPEGSDTSPDLGPFLPPPCVAPAAKPAHVLLLYAGSGASECALQHLLRAAGHSVLAIDIEQGGAAHDVSRQAVRSRIRALVAAGVFDAVFAAPPCKSFSVPPSPKGEPALARPSISCRPVLQHAAA